ncbi:MAG: class I tRNA ligase family protein, partial [Pseudomonadota bacterium]|nr:class I tRNA ligase family protein [Pseudomonadota bacterium]
MQTTTKAMRENMTNYRLDLAAKAIYEFTWHEFCDWYLELCKPILQSEDTSPAAKRGTRRTLITVLEAILRMLHPFMPFVTEEIWAPVAKRAGIDGQTIMLQSFPEPDESLLDDDAERELEWVMQFILGIRQIRGEFDISPGRPLPVFLESAQASDLEFANRNVHLLARVGRVESVDTVPEGEEAPPAATALLGNMRIHVPMAGLVDVESEQTRIGKQLNKASQDLEKAKAKLSNENFVNNAPPAVVRQERERVAEFEQQIQNLQEQFQRLEALKSP